jgi:hypothetical protein
MASIAFHLPQVGEDLRKFAVHLLGAKLEARMTHAFTVRRGMITAPAYGAEH